MDPWLRPEWLLRSASLRSPAVIGTSAGAFGEWTHQKAWPALRPGRRWKGRRSCHDPPSRRRRCRADIQAAAPIWSIRRVSWQRWHPETMNHAALVRLLDGLGMISRSHRRGSSRLRLVPRPKSRSGDFVHGGARPCDRAGAKNGPVALTMREPCIGRWPGRNVARHGRLPPPCPNPRTSGRAAHRTPIQPPGDEAACG